MDKEQQRPDKKLTRTKNGKQQTSKWQTSEKQLTNNEEVTDKVIINNWQRTDKELTTKQNIGKL